MSNEQLLNLAADDLGMEVDDMVHEFAFESVVPGVCHDCHATHDACEPDATNNWCDVCEHKAVRSILVLAGVI